MCLEKGTETPIIRIDTKKERQYIKPTIRTLILQIMDTDFSVVSHPVIREDQKLQQLEPSCLDFNYLCPKNYIK